MNVKTTFLYDKILEDVYVVQLTNFEQSINQICKLNKILYDLKQSSKVWFETLIKFLFSLNYVLLLLLLIHTRCDIVLRRFMRKILYILQKENFSKERKILLF
jgi:hypothetical protein